MTSLSRWVWAGFSLVACAGAAEPDIDQDFAPSEGADAGAFDTGGAPSFPVATGGASATGGSSFGTGGTTAAGGSSGAATTGGATGSGGQSAGTGGSAIGTGGVGSGGTGSGGAGTGGAAGCVFPFPCPTGGTTGSGGTTATGGTTGVGGGLPGFTPAPDNPPECPEGAPVDPWGPCGGLPVYLGCNYTNGMRTYACVCDWIHWICI